MSKGSEMLRRTLRLNNPRRELFGVAQALLPLVRGAKGPWVVMVSGVEGGEGATTVARNLADLVAREYAIPVCLVRVADPQGATPQGATPQGATPQGAQANRAQANRAADALAPVRRAMAEEADPAEVLLVDLSRQSLGAAMDAGLRESLSRISQYAGVFLIDGPPLLDSIDAGRLCAEVDGMILVAEADRTTPEAVDAARAAIDAYGGRLIGGVLNKRRHRLPAFLEAMVGGVFRPRVGPLIDAAPRDRKLR